MLMKKRAFENVGKGENAEDLYIPSCVHYHTFPSHSLTLLV